MYNEGLLNTIVSSNGEIDHRIIQEALDFLREKNKKFNGIMISIPHGFFKNLSFDLEEDGYAVCQVNLSINELKREADINFLEKTLLSENLQILGKRVFKDTMQIFVKKPREIQRGFAFEKLLYKVKCKMKESLDIMSFSSKIIIYKAEGLLEEKYSELTDLKLTSNFIIFEASDEELTLNNYIAYKGRINTINANMLDFEAKFGPIFKKATFLSDVLEYLYFEKEMPYEQAVMAIRGSSKIKNEFFDYFNRIYTQVEGSLLLMNYSDDKITIYADDDLSSAFYRMKKDGYIYIMDNNIQEFALSAKGLVEQGSLIQIDLNRAVIAKLKNLLPKFEIKENELFEIPSEISNDYEPSDDAVTELIDYVSGEAYYSYAYKTFTPSFRKVRLDYYINKKNWASSAYVKSIFIGKNEYNAITNLANYGYSIKKITNSRNALENIKEYVKNGCEIIIIEDEEIDNYIDELTSLSKKTCFILKSNEYSFNNLAYYLSKGISLIYPNYAYSLIKCLEYRHVIDNDSIEKYLRFLKNNLSRLMLSYGIHNVRGFISSNLIKKEPKKLLTNYDAIRLMDACQLIDYDKYLAYSKYFNNHFGYSKPISINDCITKMELKSYFRCIEQVSGNAKKCLNKALNQNILFLEKSKISDIKNHNEILINTVDDSKISNGLKTYFDITSVKDLNVLTDEIRSINKDAHIMIRLYDKTDLLPFIKSGADEIIIDSIEDLKECNDYLVSLNLRDNILLSLEHDYRNAYDIINASINGSDRFFFKKTILIPLGCMLLNKCNNCPMGVASNNEAFKGNEESISTFINFITKETCDISSLIGYKGFKHLFKNNMHINNSLDDALIQMAQTGINTIDLCANYENNIGTKLSYYTDNKLTVNLTGHAGYGFGAYLKENITLVLSGDASNYVGKCLDGGTLVVKLDSSSALADDKNVIALNSCFYKARSGVGYIDGVTGANLALCNDGATIVVLATGDYGCSYMNSGTVLVLGDIGDYFGYMFNGGRCFVYDINGDNKNRLDKRFVHAEALDGDDSLVLLKLIEDFANKTNSRKAKALSKYVDSTLFFKVVKNR